MPLSAVGHGAATLTPGRASVQPPYRAERRTGLSGSIRRRSEHRGRWHGARALVTHILAAKGLDSATGLASHSCALTTGAAPRLRDFNHASLSAIRSAGSAKSGSSSIIGARATSTSTTARHATQAVAIPIQISIGTSSMLLGRRPEVNALFRALVPLAVIGADFAAPFDITHRPRLRRRKIVNPQATPPGALSQITGCQAYQRCHSFACFAANATDALGMRHSHLPRSSAVGSGLVVHGVRVMIR